MASFLWPQPGANDPPDADPVSAADAELEAAQAEQILQGLAGIFAPASSVARHVVYPPGQPGVAQSEDHQFPNLEARYRALVEHQMDGVMVSCAGQLTLNYVPFETLVDPETLVTVVRHIPPGSDFHRLARFLENYPPE